MSGYVVTLTVPENLYTRLEAQAQAAARSVSEVALQALVRSLAPVVEKDLPPALQAELEAMEHLSDEMLW